MLDWLDYQWATIIAAGGSAVGVMAIAVKEFISLAKERPSIEAFLRVVADNRIAVIIVNTGRRPAKNVRYSFIPYATKEEYVRFGCQLDFNDPSAPFTLLNEFPVERWISHLNLVWKEATDYMPLIQVKVTYGRGKEKVVDLDVMTLWNITWAGSPLEKVLNQMQPHYRLFENLSLMARELYIYFGSQNVANENLCETHQQKCPDCNEAMKSYTYSGIRNATRPRHLVCPTALPRFMKKYHEQVEREKNELQE